MENHKSSQYDLVSFSSEETSSADDDVTQETQNSNQTTVLGVMRVLSNYDLRTAFLNLFLAYPGLSSLPASSTSAEKKFLKVILTILFIFINFCFEYL